MGGTFKKQCKYFLFFCCFGVGGVLQGFQILGADKKTKINRNAFYPLPKFETLVTLFDF
jgi:hypothetical protein